MKKISIREMIWDGIKIASAVVFLIFASTLSFMIVVAVGVIAWQDLFFETSLDVSDSFVSLVTVIVWPLAALLILIFLVGNKTFRNASSALIARLTKVKLGDYEVSFSEEGAQKLKLDVEGSIQEFAEQGQKAYDRAARVRKVRESLEALIDKLHEVSKTLGTKEGKGFVKDSLRATVHIEDVVFEESLYQLLDYFPTGHGRGRRFSFRYGAIGLAWRSGESRYWNMNDPSNSEQELIQKWGMTETEANHSRKYVSGFCIVLRTEEGLKSGVLYIDVKHLTVFTDETDHSKQNKFFAEFINEVEQGKILQGLANAANLVSSDVAKSGAFVNIYD